MGIANPPLITGLYLLNYGGTTMEITLGIIIGIIALVLVALFLFEYRIRRPDLLVLYESKGRISVRKGPIYPRHFSLPLKRTTYPIQLSVEATAIGNLGVRIKLVGSIAASLEHIQSLIRIGGWHTEAVGRAAVEAQLLLQSLVKEYTEHAEIHALTSTDMQKYLSERAEELKEKFGVELVSLAVQTLEATDPIIGDALRQQEQARLLEQTERLKQIARAEAAKAKFQADEEITQMEHALELKKAQLNDAMLEKESALAERRLQDELARNRMRLAFEREELEVLKNSPELLMLTPQAARLAEASQNLKNARTIVSLTPQELAQGSELINLFQRLVQKTLETKKEE
jgi:hypothetical protein